MCVFTNIRRAEKFSTRFLILDLLISQITMLRLAERQFLKPLNNLSG